METEQYTKYVDTQEYVTMLRSLTEEGHEVSMVIAGNSMSPLLIHQRDSICFRKPDRELRRGDIVFYQRLGGQYVCHRICRVAKEGYYIVGDAQTEIEGPVSRDQIFARITKIKRKGRWIGPGDFWWEFFEKVWVRIIPFRKSIIRLYGIVMKKR